VNDRIVIHPEVLDACAERRPVVVLETAVLTHGLPRHPMPSPPRLVGDEGAAARTAREACWGAVRNPREWDGEAPLNLEVARLIEATVRCRGAIPATVAVIAGALHVGVEPTALAELAAAGDSRKCSTRELGPVIAASESGGTTVAGTLAAMRAANRILREKGLSPLEVFATGGIGGVHRGWNETGDISSDIRALAETPAAVVSAGAKVILDLDATLEALETHMVPVLGWRTDRFPMFTAQAPPDGRPLPSYSEMDRLAEACRVHWDDLARREGVLVANEIPTGMGLDPVELERKVTSAIAEARSSGIEGARVTPHLLARLAETTEGDALDSNITLICSNASVAARLADLLCA